MTDLLPLDSEREAAAVPRLRNYRPEDLDGVIEVFVRASAKPLHADIRPPRSRRGRRLTGTFGNVGVRRQTWVAELDGELAGFTDLEFDGHVDVLYVHPDYGGKGVAHRLLETVEEHARKARVLRLHAEVGLTARSTFERFGFDVVEQQTVARNGQEFVRFKMQKLIGG